MRRDARGGNGGSSRNGWKQWVVFVVVAAVLFSLVLAIRPMLVRHRIFGGDSLNASQSLSIGLTDAPASLDIRTEQGTPIEQALLGNVYETLLSRDEDNKVRPGLAESWKTSKDGLTLTFTLRDGLRFANGHTLDATDVVWSLQQATANHYVGSDGLAALESVTNPTRTTVRLTLSHPDPRLSRALAGRAGVVLDAEAADTDYATQTAGSGPYTVRQYTVGSTMTLMRNNRYWGASPAAEQVTLRYYASDSAALTAALTGDQVDMAVPDPAADLSAVRGNTTLRVTEGQSDAVMTLVYNNDTDAMGSIRPLREALRLGLDKTDLASALPDAAQPLGGPLAPLEPGYEDLTGLWPHDLEQTQQKLAYFNGGRGFISNLRFLVPAKYQTVGQAVADRLKAMGAGVTMETLDDAALAERVESRQFDLLLTVYAGDDVADQYATAEASQSHWATTPEAREQWDRAMAATNARGYREAMAAYAKLVSQDAASDWLYVRKSVVAAAKSVTGMPKNMADRRLPLASLRKE